MSGHGDPEPASASVAKLRAQGDRSSGNTLLPSPFASAVSLVTLSTSLSLRFWTYLGGFAINSARATTLTGLELSRAVVEGILIRAGRDVVSRSGDEHGRTEAESLLERSIAALHSTINSASFFASAGFHLSFVTLSSVTSFTQTLLSTLDAILGSTESSRAIAAIITLIRRELRNPELIPPGEIIGVGDLLVGSIGFVLLQRWGRRQTDKEIRQTGSEESIWDIVILDNGTRADVVGTHQTKYGEDVDIDGADSSSIRPSSFLIPHSVGGDESLDAVERGNPSLNHLSHLVPHVSLYAGGSQHDPTDEEIRRYIIEQLPQGCHATIKTDTVTARTITVDVFDSGRVDISPPPGTTKLEERVQPEYNHTMLVNADGDAMPKHTIVFGAVSNSVNDSAMSIPSNAPTPESLFSWPHSDVGDKTPLHESAAASLESSPRMRPKRMIRQRRNSASDTSGSETPRAIGTKGSARTSSKPKGKAESKPGNTLSTPRKLLKGVSSTALSSAPRASSSKEVISKLRPTLTTSQKGTNFSKERDMANVKPMVRSSPVMADNTNRLYPLSPKKGKPNTRKLDRDPSHEINPGGSLASGRYLLREKSSESFLSQTDAYAMRPSEGRSSSPSFTREHIHNTSSLSRARSDKDMSPLFNFTSRPTTPAMSRRNSSKSVAPSIYSIATGSETSLLLAHRTGKSAYDDNAALSSLARTGYVPGLYPPNSLVRNIRRFSRFSSASYGSNFLKVMGISSATQQLHQDPVDHHEHSSFSYHTGLPTSTILLSSYVDPAGGTNAAGVPSEGFPLVHYLAIDHESKAAVLTLRGTWGFEDILTDMTCDYDDITWLGKTYQVHKGMLASAKRLLEGGGGKVMSTIRTALEEFPDYGVIFCGHSLGGGVAALLATLISQPQHPDLPGPSFITSSNQTPTGLLPAIAQEVSQHTQPQEAQYSLPPGRPVHVYAYGPPAVMSPPLRLATRGLITTIVNGHDVVPTLSLGVLHDFHSVALSFKRDVADAKSQVKARVWEAITRSITNKVYMDTPLSVYAGDGVGEDSWAWNTLKSLRDGLTARKLLPPGEVFVVETMRVLQRDAFTGDVLTGDAYPRLGRPATRIQLKYIRDVEKRFGEVRFGSGMLLDHSPARYENTLAILAHGVLED